MISVSYGVHPSIHPSSTAYRGREVVVAALKSYSFFSMQYLKLLVLLRFWLISSRNFWWNVIWQRSWSSCVRSLARGHLITAAAAWIASLAGVLSVPAARNLVQTHLYHSSSPPHWLVELNWRVPGVPLEVQTSWQTIQWWPLPHCLQVRCLNERLYEYM